MEFAIIQPRHSFLVHWVGEYFGFCQLPSGVRWFIRQINALNTTVIMKFEKCALHIANQLLSCAIMIFLCKIKLFIELRCNRIHMEGIYNVHIVHRDCCQNFYPFNSHKEIKFSN